MAYNNVKAEHAFQTFHKDLKTNIFPEVIFMYGEEEYLIQWAVNSLADKFVEKSMRDIDYVKANENEEIDELLALCDTFSMMSERRIIWAKDYAPLLKKNSKGFGEKELERLVSYITNPNPQSILIFSAATPEDGSAIVKYLKKECKTYAFDRLDRPQLNGFAEKRFRAAGTNIERSVLKYLIDETGYFNRETEYTIFNLENDIKKIIAYNETGNITVEDINQTLKGDLDKFAFDFLDAVTSGRKDKAFRILNNILGNGGEVFSVLGLLVNQFELMLETKEMAETSRDTDRMASVLKMNPYRVKKALSYADKFEKKKLQSILSQLYEIDRTIKTGMMEQNLALELLIGRI